MNKLDEDKLVKIVRLLVISIYGKELTMEDDGNNYLKFYSRGPRPPYHRNAWGKLWVDDDRLLKRIMGVLSVDEEEAYEIMSIYFSKTYNTYVKKAEMEYDYEDIDYAPFDDENNDW